MLISVSGWCGPLQSESLANWAGAVGTSIAATIAALVYWRSWIDRRKSQARLVSIHIVEPILLRKPPYKRKEPVQVYAQDDEGFYNPGEEDGIGSWVMRRSLEIEYHVANHSGESISNVVAALVDSTGKVLRAEFTKTRVLSPHVARTSYRYLTKFDDLNPDDLVLRFRFTDAVGRHWERSAGRPLVRIADHSPTFESWKSVQKTIEEMDEEDLNDADEPEGNAVEPRGD